MGNFDYQLVLPVISLATYALLTLLLVPFLGGNSRVSASLTPRYIAPTDQSAPTGPNHQKTGTKPDRGRSRKRRIRGSSRADG